MLFMYLNVALKNSELMLVGDRFNSFWDNRVEL